MVRAASDRVQYVGGTVKSIPVNSTGTFNFEDAKEFRFNYNGRCTSCPTIRSPAPTSRKADIRRVWHVFPAMSPIASHRKQTLVINYTDAGGATGTLNFELMAYRAVDAQETIAAKRSPYQRPPPAQAIERMVGRQVLEDEAQSRPLGMRKRAQNARLAAQKAQNAAPPSPANLLPAERSIYR